MNKKIGCLVIALSLTLSIFAGCSNQKSTQDMSTTKEVKNDPFKISVSSWALGEDVAPDTRNADYKTEVEKKFKEKYPTGSIVWNNMPNEKYFDVLKSKFAAGAADDVVFYQQGAYKMFSSAGYLEDLSSLPVAQDMVDSAKRLMTVKGKVYGIAQDVSVLGAFYNKKVFADAGIAAPPKTWKELTEDCEKIKAKGVAPFVGGFKDQWTLVGVWGCLFAPFIFENSTNFIMDVYNGKSKFDGPEYKVAFGKFQELVQKGYFNKNLLSIGWDQSRVELGTGKAAILLQGNFLPGMMKTEYKDTEIGYFPIPDDNGKTVLSVGTNLLMGVNSKSKNIDKAKELVTIMNDKAVLAPLFKDQNFSALKSVTVDFALPALKDIQTVLKNNPTAVQPDTFIAPSTQDILVKALTKVAAGSKFDENDLSAADTSNTRDKALINVNQ